MQAGALYLFVSWLHYGKLWCLQRWGQHRLMPRGLLHGIKQIIFLLYDEFSGVFLPEVTQVLLVNSWLHCNTPGFVFLFTPSSLCPSCLRLKLFPGLWISLCIFCFLETCLLWKAKLQRNFFSRDPPEVPRNHLVFCTVSLSPTRSHLSWLLYKQSGQAGRRGPLCYQ